MARAGPLVRLGVLPRAVRAHIRWCWALGPQMPLLPVHTTMVAMRHNGDHNGDVLVCDDPLTALLISPATMLE